MVATIVVIVQLTIADSGGRRFVDLEESLGSSLIYLCRAALIHPGERVPSWFLAFWYSSGDAGLFRFISGAATPDR
jgi:hypothetical protein